MNAKEAWHAAYHHLEITYDRPAFNTWLRDTVLLGCNNGEFVIGVGNAYARDMLQHRLYDDIEAAIAAFYEGRIALTFELVRQEDHFAPDSVYDQDDETMPLFAYMAQQPTNPGGSIGQYVARPQQPAPAESELNPRFTFDRFVTNRANHMVYEAARAVAEQPTGVYNPLLIYGGVGLGKTHLLQSIAHACRNRGLNVCYVPSEAFTNDLVLAIRKRQQAMFRERYRSLDVLVVDDIQFIAGKESTQEEFFHTFNALVTFNKQVVLASDRHPSELHTLEDRLQSRFAGGLIMDVQPPEFETRVAILHMWAAELGVPMTNDLAAMIAENAPNNIREMEGVFKLVIAKMRFAPGQLDMYEAAHTVAQFERPRHHSRRITIDAVLEATSEAYNMDVAAIVGKRRTKRVSHVRQVAMYLIRELTDTSLPQIGMAFGGRAHSTVLHSCNKLAEELETDTNLREQVEALRAYLTGE